MLPIRQWNCRFFLTFVLALSGFALPLIGMAQDPDLPQDEDCPAEQVCAHPVASSASAVITALDASNSTPSAVVLPSSSSTMRSLDMDARRAVQRAIENLQSYRHFTTVESNTVVRSNTRVVILVSRDDRCRVELARVNADDWRVVRSTCTFRAQSR